MMRRIDEYPVGLEIELGSDWVKNELQGNYEGNKPQSNHLGLSGPVFW